LVFSGAPGERPEAVPIATVAEWLDKSGVQLVYLSCCRSSAASAALELARSDVPLTIGFNWNLDDEKAVDFARDFYGELLNEARLKVCVAFSRARRTLYRYFSGGDPIWAAPVLIAQPEDWSVIERGLRPLSAPRPGPRTIKRRRRPGANKPRTRSAA
jgi:CHAT domain-containing protein